MSIERCQRCVGGVFQDAVVTQCLPVDAFGDVAGKQVQVVTIGLNPALSEFFRSNISIEQNHRLPILSDYRIANRANLKDSDIDDAQRKRRSYFTDPQRSWHPYFERFELVLSRVRPTWSYISGRVVHIDLVACATKPAFGDLTGECKSGLVNCCQEFFLANLAKLPDGTLLLLDGKTVVTEIRKLDPDPKWDSKGQTIDKTGNLGFAGKIDFQGKQFPFWGWSMPIGRLTMVSRYNLAYWIGKTMDPPAPFLPISK